VKSIPSVIPEKSGIQKPRLDGLLDQSHHSRASGNPVGCVSRLDSRVRGNDGGYASEKIAAGILDSRVRGNDGLQMAEVLPTRQNRVTRYGRGSTMVGRWQSISITNRPVGVASVKPSMLWPVASSTLGNAGARSMIGTLS